MVFLSYPFGYVPCSMRMASYGYTAEDIIFKWKAASPIQVTSDLYLRGYSMVGFTTDYCDSMTNTGVYSCLRMDLLFKREFSRALFNVYFPMMASLVLLWLTMWINPGKEHGNIIRLLGLLGAIAYNKWAESQLTPSLPPVSYITSFGKWVIWCNIFILVAILEFLIVLGMGKGENSREDDEEGKGEMGVILNRIWRNQSRTGKVDMIMKVIYPIALIVFVIYYFSCCTGPQGIEKELLKGYAV